MVGVPIDDDRREKIEPGDPEVLALDCSIADLALATDPLGAFQGMVCLPLVQADLRPTLRVGIEQPVDDEQCAFTAAAEAHQRGDAAAVARALADDRRIETLAQAGKNRKS